MLSLRWTQFSWDHSSSQSRVRELVPESSNIPNIHLLEGEKNA